jgi:hypothetical protein
MAGWVAGWQRSTRLRNLGTACLALKPRAHDLPGIWCSLLGRVRYIAQQTYGALQQDFLQFASTGAAGSTSSSGSTSGGVSLNVSA